MFPERLHAVSLAIELVAELLDTVRTASSRTADEVARWDSTTDPALVSTTRARLERLLDEGAPLRTS